MGRPKRTLGVFVCGCMDADAGKLPVLILLR